jgi:hypothetical protein
LVEMIGFVYVALLLACAERTSEEVGVHSNEAIGRARANMDFSNTSLSKRSHCFERLPVLQQETAHLRHKLNTAKAVSGKLNELINEFCANHQEFWETNLCQQGRTNTVALESICESDNECDSHINSTKRQEGPKQEPTEPSENRGLLISLPRPGQDICEAVQIHCNHLSKIDQESLTSTLPSSVQQQNARQAAACMKHNLESILHSDQLVGTIRRTMKVHQNTICSSSLPNMSLVTQPCFSSLSSFPCRCRYLGTSFAASPIMRSVQHHCTAANATR